MTQGTSHVCYAVSQILQMCMYIFSWGHEHLKMKWWYVSCLLALTILSMHMHWNKFFCYTFPPGICKKAQACRAGSHYLYYTQFHSYYLIKIQIRCSDQIADHHLMVYRVQDCNAWSSSAVHDACDVCRAMWNNLDNNLEASEATEQRQIFANIIIGAWNNCSASF